MFGEKISFTTVFDKEATANYSEPLKDDKCDAIRTVMVEKLSQTITGIIVGKVWKCDGKYYKAESYVSSSFEFESEYCPASFCITKKWPFWVVYADMNEQYLVPINYMPQERYAISDDCPLDLTRPENYPCSRGDCDCEICKEQEKEE